MEFIKLIRRFFTRDKDLTDLIAEAITEGIKEIFREMGYPFAKKEIKQGNLK